METNPIDLGKYVYKDDAGIIHSNENCIKLKFGKDSKGHSIYAKLPIDTAEILEIGRVCARCVDNTTYNRLNNICLRNKEIDYNRKWLYNKLKWAGYDMEDYDLFIYHIASEQKRKRLFSTAQEEGWDLGSFKEFSSILGF